MRFLGLEWLECLASSASDVAIDIALAVHQRVTGGPGGDVEFTLRFAGGTLSVEVGPGAADVEIVEDYETAAAISRGLLSPAAAFASGRLRLGGSIGLLLQHQEALAAVGRRMTGMADATTY